MQALNYTDTSHAADLLTLSFSDWEHSKSVMLEFPADASVAEAVDEARNELSLPNDVLYQALHGGRQLDGLATLRETGLAKDAEIDLMPDVKAGLERDGDA
jgi:hypothetical protein